MTSGDCARAKSMVGIPDCATGQTHERAYALNRRSVWPKNTNWGLIGAAFHKFPTFIARIRRVNSIIFLYKDFMRLPWIVRGPDRMRRKLWKLRRKIELRHSWGISCFVYVLNLPFMRSDLLRIQANELRIRAIRKKQVADTKKGPCVESRPFGQECAAVCPDTLGTKVSGPPAVEVGSVQGVSGIKVFYTIPVIVCLDDIARQVFFPD